MKKLYLLLAAVAGAVLILLPACSRNSSREEEPKNRYYSLVAVVTRTDAETDTVYLEDCNGNIWSLYGVEDWTPGDAAAIIMDDNGTELIYNDMIISATYSAWNLRR